MLSTALGLSACSAHKGALWKHPPSHVNNVEVTLAKPMGSPALAETIRVKTLAEASRYGAVGNAKTLRVSITHYHKKNPALSLLLSDSNNIRADVSVVDTTTLAEDTKMQMITSDPVPADGIIGAVVAISQTEAEVEEMLTTQFASEVLARVYGSKAAKIARKNPPSVVAPAATPPGTVPKPAAKGTPVALAAPQPAPAPAPAPAQKAPRIQ
ncbi:hypothetical protein IZ6_18900 [Terrihabitans soli]|uniref:DUF3313 domain-containing protein n=1 Tax=Terrihabitans soli TaxID=708113 RepID=A0A6S6QUB4_9HYPH|nr:hypothetical protein IZ6_18900 [Terrihabitans soli]